MNTDLERRLNALEVRCNPEPPQRVAIIVMRPNEDKQAVIARYYAECGETPPAPKSPHLHVLIHTEDSDTRNVYR